MSRYPIFSEREQEVVARLLEGKSNKQIALALHITVRTVEFHLGNIYSKLEVPSRSEAIIKLSNSQLWKSTGEPEYHELRQTTVESGSQPPENKRKPFGSVSDLHQYAGSLQITEFLSCFRWLHRLKQLKNSVLVMGYNWVEERQYKKPF